MRNLTRITANALLAAALASAALVAGGCSSDGYDGDYYGYDDGGYYEDGYVVEREYYYDRPYPYRRGGYYGGHRGYRDHPRYYRSGVTRRVPRDAAVVANGNGPLGYTADQPGRVYVRDEKTGKVIYSGRVRPGQDVLVGADAKGRRVSVDGRTARGELSARPREREVYFRPDRGTAAGPTRSTRAAERADAREAQPAAARETRRSSGGGGKSGSGRRNND